MNHLLSFQFEQRGLNADDAAHGRLGISPTGRRRGAGGTRVRLTREQFLQVNGQFFVRETADVSVQAVDPDQPVPWSEVHQVLLQSHEVQQCPICLAPPVAGQITRCGHVYCLYVDECAESLGERPRQRERVTAGRQREQAGWRWSWGFRRRQFIREACVYLSRLAAHRVERKRRRCGGESRRGPVALRFVKITQLEWLHNFLGPLALLANVPSLCLAWQLSQPVFRYCLITHPLPSLFLVKALHSPPP